MAKVSFAKLGLKINNEVKTFEWSNGNEVTVVEVKQYLPIEEKLVIISNIINNSIDENDFYNPVRLEIFTALEILYAYTNFNITPKMKEDPLKLYDIVSSSGLYEQILNILPKTELNQIKMSARATINNIYNYKNSAVGILSSISSDYSNLNLNADEIKNKIGNPENLEFLREILTKLG